MKLAARRQMREVGERDAVVADLAGQLAHLLMRQLEELVEQAELVHDLERRGMDGVAAEVAQEIGVLLEHHHLDAGAGEQIAQHHAGGPAAGDAAACGDGLRGMRRLSSLALRAMALRWCDRSWKRGALAVQRVLGVPGIGRAC